MTGPTREDELRAEIDKRLSDLKKVEHGLATGFQGWGWDRTQAIDWLLSLEAKRERYRLTALERLLSRPAQAEETEG